MKKWRCDYDIKLYVLSHGWAEANKVFMSNTNNGDMSLLIDDYFDTSMGLLHESKTYENVLKRIQQSPCNVIFLTKSASAAKAALIAGIFPILVLTHKRMYDMLSEVDKRNMAIVRTMNEIEFEAINPDHH